MKLNEFKERVKAISKEDWKWVVLSIAFIFSICALTFLAIRGIIAIF